VVGPTNWNLAASGAHAEVEFDYEGDHRGLAISRLPGFLRDKTHVQQLTRSLGGGVQDAEDIVWGALVGSILPLATGKTLDRWGLLVGEHRGSLLSDVDYRPIIQARILANACTGDIDSVMSVLKEACRPVICVEQMLLPPGGFQIQVTREEPMGEPRRLRVRRIMALCTPSGRDARYVEIVEGGFAPTASCARGVFGGPLAREI
jgi:hypothetical protein